MSKVELIKNWIGRHKKFVIIGSVLFALLVAVVFGITFSLSRIYGSAYDVDNIGNNIDKIKVGDSISYTANGYSDWKVLSIDKENHTIDVISNGSVGDLTIKHADRENFLDILQAEANKYMDGKYAISARSIGTTQEESTLIDSLGYWVAYQASDALGHSPERAYYYNYEYEYSSFSGSFLPLVTLNVGDSTSFSVGQTYYYSLNGVNDWKILYINDSTSISIIPTSTIYFEDKQSIIPNFGSYIENEVAKFKDDNVINVRAVTDDDREAMQNINYNNRCFYTGKVELDEEEFEYNDDDRYAKRGYIRHKLMRYDCSYNSYNITTGWTSGFIPVVTLKYDKEYTDRKDADTELKVGDYVKYSANAYDSWKVLSIDKENQTADIISSGVVKNLTLRGKEDYDNYETILQEAINSYKVGDSAVAVRPVTIEDFDNMEKAGIRTNAQFLLTSKRAYRQYYYSGFYYAVQVGGLDSYSLSFYNTWYDLAFIDISTSMTSKPERNYTVTAGVLPIVTLKLDYVEKGSVVKTDDSKFVKEQKKANTNAEVVTEEEMSKTEEVVEDDIKEEDTNTNDALVKNIAELSNIVNDVKKSIKDLKSMAIAVIVLLVGVLGFVFVDKFRKGR